MGIMETLVALMGILVVALGVLFKVERANRKLIEKDNEFMRQITNELEHEATHLNQRAESAEALQIIEQERREKDEEAIRSASGRDRKPLGRM